jgi:hypothetical protein
MGTTTAQLILQNPTTQEIYEYNFIGICEDPLAEDHIVLDCVARQIKTHNISIKNTNTTTELKYKIESDINGISGDDSIIIAPMQSKN